MDEYYAVQKEDYIAHYGIKGMKWGVRRTPAQLGHSTVKRINSLRSRIKKAQATHTSNVVARNKRKTARLNAKNEVLRAKTERAELKARQNAANGKNGKNGKKDKNLVKSGWGGFKSGVSEGLKKSTSDIITRAIASSLTLHYSDILNDPKTTNGKKAFAELMGGNYETSSQAASERRVDRVIKQNKKARKYEEERLASLRNG